MSVIHIRRADVPDAELISDLSRKTFYETFAAANTEENMQLFMNEQFSKESLMSEVYAGDGIFFLAYFDREPAGYVFMREGKGFSPTEESPAIEIARIYSLQSAIGKGIGKALMHTCIETAKQLNRKMIWLGVWEHNTRAIDFYKHWGFEKYSEHEFILGKDIQVDWLMRKYITG